MGCEIVDYDSENNGLSEFKVVFEGFSTLMIKWCFLDHLSLMG